MHPGDVQAVFCDVDGVLTDGGIYMWDAHKFALRFDVKDGFGMRALIEQERHVVWVTGRSGEAVRARAAELGIHKLYESARDKAATVQEYASSVSVPLARCAFIGDDMPDLPAMAVVGLSVAVADAHLKVRQSADWVLQAPGGHGALREVADTILA